MMSSPTPLPSTSRYKPARKINRRDRDATMKDLTPTTAKSKTGGMTGTSGKKLGHRNRAMDTIQSIIGKRTTGPSLSSRVGDNVSPLSIRGAADGSSRSGKVMGIIKARTQQTLRRTPTTASAVEIWKQFVQSRWNPEAKFLNLENMSDDPILRKNNMHSPVHMASTGKEMSVICKIASQLQPQVQTISLAHNTIGLHAARSCFSPIPRYLPWLANLSLESCSLKDWKDLDLLSARAGRLMHLRELILLGNPLRDREAKIGKLDRYQSEAKRRFPTLEVLDQAEITTITFDNPLASTSTSAPAPVISKPEATSFPFPMAPPFLTGVDPSIIDSFLMRFLSLFDNQRAALADVYAPNATFSYSALTAIPDRARIQGFHMSKEMPNQRKLDWKPWLPGSRNLTRTGFESTFRRLHTGPDDIIKAIADLPKTTHDLTGDPGKFNRDAWPIGQGTTTLLFTTVHGEFAEAPSNGIRSFDRSFVLAPAPEGSRARTTGWDVVILSDQLLVRAYSSPAAWAPGPMRIQTSEAASTSTSTLLPPQPPLDLSKLKPEVLAQLNGELATIPEPQRSIVMGICSRTGLNVKFSVDCLESNGWNVERAVTNFQQVKGSLDRSAFL